MGLRPSIEAVLPVESKKKIGLLWRDGSRYYPTAVYDMTDPAGKDLVIIKRLADHLNEALSRYENDWVGIFLQGSQNYGIDTEDSDVDSTIIVLPTLKELINGDMPISETIHLENGEHCEVKDIRLMFRIFLKQNINALEILATRWKIINPQYEDDFNPLCWHVDLIARYDRNRFVDGLMGMMYNNKKRMTNPTPVREAKIGEYGYDGKCLCNMDRMYEFFTRFILDGEPFKACLISKKKELLLAAKAQRYTLDCAMVTAEALMEEMCAQRAELKKLDEMSPQYNLEEIRKRVEQLLDDSLEFIMCKYLRAALCATEDK